MPTKARGGSAAIPRLVKKGDFRVMRARFTTLPRFVQFAAVVGVLVLALSGTAGAARLITGDQIKDGSITGADIKGGSVGASDINASARDALRGPRGATGSPGAAGAQGPVGPIGASGPAGAKGDQGARGLAGPKGDTGAAGPAGPQGDSGATGPAGPTGGTGAQGPKGDVGDQGHAGPKGDVGPAGPANVVVRKTTASVISGTQPVITAMCQPGEKAVGGSAEGAYANNGSFTSVLTPGGDYPVNSEGVKADTGDVPRGWQARFTINDVSGSQSIHGAAYVYVICVS